MPESVPCYLSDLPAVLGTADDKIFSKVLKIKYPLLKHTGYGMNQKHVD